MTGDKVTFSWVTVLAALLGLVGSVVGVLWAQDIDIKEKLEQKVTQTEFYRCQTDIKESMTAMERRLIERIDKLEGSLRR